MSSECELDDCHVCQDGWTCDECGDSFKHRDANAVHDEEAMCDPCAHIAVANLRALLEQSEIERTKLQAEVARLSADRNAELGREGLEGK